VRRWLAIAGGVWCGAAAPAVAVAAASPVLSRTAAGRFEIASLDAAAAQRVRAAAEEAWRWLAEPLDLGDGFATPIFVRLVPAADWAEVAPFRVMAEPGGIVSVRLRWSEATPELFVRRALVQALLVRCGIGAHGVSERLTAPLWLEQACVEWWRTREEPAQMDALQQESAALAPPDLHSVLAWQRSDVEPRVLGVGALWLLTWLRAESTSAGEWAAFRTRILGGADPDAALADCFPGRFSDPQERELWWQTGWHHVRRVPGQPMLGIEESRLAVVELGRFVFGVGGDDGAVPLRFVLRRAGEPPVQSVLRDKAAGLRRLLPGLHPFYRNAGLALAECLAGAPGDVARLDALVAEFEREWDDATDLERTSREALDALAARRR
jgi:hypothetical protein